jgi:hypothetical protein
MSKKGARTRLFRYTVARVPGGGKLILMNDGSGAVLVKGKVSPHNLELPGVRELIRELTTAIDRAHGRPDDVGTAIRTFRTGFRLAIASASPTENAPIAHPQVVTAPNKFDPPKIAEFLLTALATTRHAESAVGDLNERFTTECEKFGRTRAVRLYWARTLRSLWPLFRRAIAKALRWGAVLAMVRRLF